MLKTLKLLRDNPLIRDFEIVDFKSGEDFYYLKIKTEISNATTLFIDVNIFQRPNITIPIIGKTLRGIY